jgi:hypothetical protein
MNLRRGDGTHHKKQRSQEKLCQAKGETPIEKNVIVIDEQGNEYEATYPKRAKGLVKNGRARFVGENKICLACPPNEHLEGNKMEENKLTAKDIFVQLTILQKQLTENSQTSLHRLGDAITSIGEEDNDARYEQVTEVCDVFKTRELTLQRMLEMYEKMYEDVQKEQARKVDMIKAAFDNNMSFIESSDIASEDKYAALGYVTEKIAELVEKVIADK